MLSYRSSSGAVTIVIAASFFSFCHPKKAVQADPVDRPHRNRAPGRGIFAAARVRLIAAPGRESRAHPSWTQVPWQLGKLQLIFVDLEAQCIAAIFVVKREVAAQ